MNSFAWWPVLAVVSVASVTDLRSRRIPNWLTLPFLVGGVVAGGIVGGLPGVGRSLAGIGIAVALLGAFCCLKGMGWGDLKLCAAVGAWIGPAQLLFALVAVAIAGGIMAVAWSLCAGRGKGRPVRLSLSDPAALKLPYAPAIAIGTLFSFFGT